MNTNKMLTYLLYALLAGLIAVAGYKTWQTKQRQTKFAQEEAEFQQSARDLIVTQDDTTGSQFEGDANPNASLESNSIVISDEGIEDDPAPSTPQPQTKTGTAKTNPAPQTTTSQPAVEPRNLDTDNSDGRYRVIAGSFTKLAGARREMERIIKMGYHDAEVGLYNRGKFAVVIVKRTDSMNEAVKIVDALQRKGIDATVVDRERKK